MEMINLPVELFLFITRSLGKQVYQLESIEYVSIEEIYFHFPHETYVLNSFNYENFNGQIYWQPKQNNNNQPTDAKQNNNNKPTEAKQ